MFIADFTDALFEQRGIGADIEQHQQIFKSIKSSNQIN